MIVETLDTEIADEIHRYGIENHLAPTDHTQEEIIKQLVLEIQIETVIQIEKVQKGLMKLDQTILREIKTIR